MLLRNVGLSPPIWRFNRCENLKSNYKTLSIWRYWLEVVTVRHTTMPRSVEQGMRINTIWHPCHCCHEDKSATSYYQHLNNGNWRVCSKCSRFKAETYKRTNFLVSFPGEYFLLSLLSRLYTFCDMPSFFLIYLLLYPAEITRSSIHTYITRMWSFSLYRDIDWEVSSNGVVRPALCS